MSALRIGSRVQHKDLMPGSTGPLPMRGKVVAVDVRYIVEWDDAEHRTELAGGGKKTHTYPAEFLVAE